MPFKISKKFPLNLLFLLQLIFYMQTSHALTATLDSENILLDESVHYDGGSYAREPVDTRCLVGTDSGIDIYRTYIEFDTTEIPDGATINSIEAHLTVSMSYFNEELLDIQQMDHTVSYWSSGEYDDAGNEALFNYITNETTKYVNDSPVFQSSGAQNISLGSTAASDMQSQLASNWFGVVLKNSTEIDDEAATFYCTEYSNSSYWPYLIVDYTYDTDPPTNASIDAPDYTNSRNITLTLNADGASQMMISESVSFSGATWEAYATSKDFTLSDGDATKTIYAKFRDEAENETDAVSTTSVLDTSVPSSASIAINSGDARTNSADVTLTISATGASQMKVSELSNYSDCSWESYATSKNFTFTTTNGTKTIYIKFKDLASNETDSYNDTIVLDTASPQSLKVGLSKNKLYEVEAKTFYSKEREFKLYLSADDIDSNITQMMISQDKNFKGATWKTYKNNIKLKFKNDGKKNIYIRLKDDAGNISERYKQVIKVDSEPPALSLDADSATIYSGYNLTLKGTSAEGTDIRLYLSGQLKTSILGIDKDKWEIYVTDLKAGTYTGLVEAEDKARNVSREAFTLVVT